MTDSAIDPIAATRNWLEKAVIGLNLCPFAKAVYVKDQVRFVLSDATTPEALVEQLAEELLLLRDTPAEQIDTTLIIHPDVLTDFLDYNDFLDNADAAFLLEDRYGIMTRCGLHCAPAAHRSLGTFPQGTVRFAPGYATTPEDIAAALAAGEEIAGEKCRKME